MSNTNAIINFINSIPAKELENIDLIDFINKNFNNNNTDTENLENNDLIKEINNIFNNLESIDTNCSYPYSKTDNISIVGLNFYNNYFVNSFNYSFLTPNLFRTCFVQKNIPIPNICPNFEKNSIIKNYLPLLLDKEYIKGFLYFNYSSDIYNNNPFITSPTLMMKNKINNILQSKRGTNYGNYTSAPVIFNYLYSSNSLLIQLLKLNVILNDARKAYTEQRVIKPFQIPWNILLYCSCNNNNIYFDNTNNNNLATRLRKTLYQVDLNAINLLYDNNNLYNSNKIILNNMNINNYQKNILKNNILKILQYSLEVYNDTLMEIEYFMLSKKYNKPCYMNISNLELLNNLYSNYTSNQKIVDEGIINYNC